MTEAQSNISGEPMKRFPGMTPAFLKRVRKVRHDERVCNGGGGACHLVSEWLEAEYGWSRISGTYTSADYKEPVVTGHYWNLLPDGAILDATADQLGEGADIRVVPPTSPTYHRYRPEFNTDFTTDDQEYDYYLRTHFPHLDRTTIHHGGDDFDWSGRLARERGRGWAVTDRDQYARYREMQKRLYGHEWQEKNDTVKEAQETRGAPDINGEVEQFATSLEREYGLTRLSLYWSKNTGMLRLDHIIVPRAKQRQGIGSQVLAKVTSFADQHGLAMSLSTAQRDPHHGTTSSSRLKRFYKRFGFVENKGRSYDPSISDNMIRRRRGQG